jgi:long-subunit acyl-CoA synthetase (AMP-forming)
VPALEADPAFAVRFFSRLRLMFNAAAALPAALRDRLADLAPSTNGNAVPITASWGATETAPAVTTAHFDYSDARCIGAPLPGTQVKLAPAEEGYEIRVKGPGVTPGYFARPDLTAAAFDDQGLGEEPKPHGELIDHERLRKELARALAELNAGQGSSARIERLLVMARPADLDAGEITDKGYVNQRRVLTNRAALVRLLYPEPGQPAQAPVIVAERTP